MGLKEGSHMMDYEIYRGAWMRSIRAISLDNALVQAKKILKENPEYIPAQIKKHDKDGYPTFLGTIHYGDDGELLYTTVHGNSREI